MAFIDAGLGEEERHGKSWMVSSAVSPIVKGSRSELWETQNTREVQTIVHLVQHYYSEKDYCIITPYDAQRAALTAALKAEDLPYENVYNVDSFQGLI